MKKISLPIDVGRYDVRVTWAGLKEDDVPADAGVVDGFPIDPPDDRTGWLLVEFGVQSTKEADRYWSLWAREKVRAKKRAKRVKTLAADPVAKPRKPRKKRNAPAEAIEGETKDETATETN